MHNLRYDLIYSVFKVAGYVKYELNFFLVFKFLTGWWSIGRWSVQLVGGRLVGDRWSVSRLVGDRLVGGFKETKNFLEYLF